MESQLTDFTFQTMQGPESGIVDGTAGEFGGGEAEGQVVKNQTKTKPNKMNCSTCKKQRRRCQETGMVVSSVVFASFGGTQAASTWTLTFSSGLSWVRSLEMTAAGLVSTVRRPISKLNRPSRQCPAG